VSFRKSVLEFIEAQLEINRNQQRITDAQRRTIEDMSQRIDWLERDMREMERRTR
jgi:hypothetical protein